MNQTEFLYWINGMLEYTNVGSLSEDDIRQKLQGIKDHLKLVFDKKMPEPKKEESAVKNKNVIEPNEALKKIFEENARKHKENRKLEDWGLPPYDDVRYGPHYWLERMPAGWGVPLKTNPYEWPPKPMC